MIFSRLIRFFKRLNPLDEPLAVLEERTGQAENELLKQREGVEREATERSKVQADIERMIIAATRDVLRRRPIGRQG